MDSIDEAAAASLNDPRIEVLSVELIHEIYDEFAIYLSTEEDEESDDYRLVQFGVGGPA